MSQSDSLDLASQLQTCSSPSAFLARHADPSCNDSLVSRFAAQVHLHGDRLAISTADSQLTYSELNAYANRYAHLLLARRLPFTEPVALFMEQGVAFISASLGTLKAGHFYVPLDPANPPQRNTQMLEDSGARCVVTSGDLVELARAAAPAGCDVLNADTLLLGAAESDVQIDVSPDALAYVLYTSGSTGRPKGVVHDHRSVLHNMMRHASAFALTPDDRQTLLYTCSVYGGTRDIYNALLSGASLHTFPVKQRGVTGLAQWLRDSRITLYCSVATVFRQLIASLDPGERFPDVRLVKLGGEATHRGDVELFRDHFAEHCRLHCGLGSTETGLVRNFFVDRHTRLEVQAVPLGYPIDDLRVELLGGDGTPVPDGEPGEIVIRSRYIARGYWQRPDLNSTVFTSDPLDPTVRLYRSGDLAVRRPDGCLEHRGRKDHVVKIHGNRVDLGEIETALRGLPGVGHAAVTARRDQHDHDYLVAYIVPRNEPFTVSGVRAALATQLPDYMIPPVVMCLANLPQTPNGKIDRQALPVPDAAGHASVQPYVAPRNAQQSAMAALWAEVLARDRVGIHDDFFDLGGNSLKAVTLMANVHRLCGVKLPLAVLFRAVTVEKLVATIEHGDSDAQWSYLVPMRVGGTKRPLFCIHPGGGNVLGYHEFIAHLPADQPVYGVQAHGVVEGQEPHTSIPEMATKYIEAIRTQQAHGPYALGGESFGGLVAFEMACQLVEAGERVEFVFLGDVWPHDDAQRRSPRYALATLTYLFTLGWSQWRALIERKVFRGDSGRILVRRYTYATELHKRMSLAHRHASRIFSPRHYRGKVTLFRALDYTHDVGRLQHFHGSAAMSWPRYAEDVEVHWMPGWHSGVMHEPYACGFAWKLQECLDSARATTPETAAK